MALENFFNNKMRELSPVIGIDKNKCVNCHACISSCPVKYCNDGSGDYLRINSNMCIGCGRCLQACTHDARYYIDDFNDFLEAVYKKKKLVAIVAPSAAANFPEKTLNFNGWLKAIGIEAVFDVSFGAELTVKSYVEYIRNHNPKVLISQPCPAIVTYIELYKPELLKYLAPVDSPMGHTIKMIKKYYPQYKDHNIVAVSPCLAKKREFNEIEQGDYNVSYISINNYFKENKIKLSKFPKIDFNNPSAERAVLFSSPGGLLRTAERWLPDIYRKARRIEGNHNIYEYINDLHEVIKQGKAPLLIDCLSCDKGCNAGPLTLVKDKPLDEIEDWIEKRNEQMQAKYQKQGIQEVDKNKIEEILSSYWEKKDYVRKYINLQKNNDLKIPNEKMLNIIFKKMHKYSDEDIYNCTACGYGECEKMAIAIYNGLNRPENCHFYLAHETDISHQELRKSERRYRAMIEDQTEFIYRWTPDGTITYINEAVCRYFNKKRHDFRNMSIMDFIHKDDHDLLKNHIASLNKKKPLGTIEHRVIMPDNEIRWHQRTDHMLLDLNGNVFEIQSVARDITERKKMEDELHYNAYHDSLTDLPNRRFLEVSLKQAIARAKRNKSFLFSLMFMDLDGFKDINDSYGHFIGDKLILKVSGRIKSCIRDNDILARFGGDEFTVLLDNIMGLDDAKIAAHRIQEALSKPFQIDDKELYISASIGIILYTPDYNSPSDMLRNVDIAMYQAKLMGKHRYAIFDAKMYCKTVQQLQLRNDIRKAMKKDQFKILYQPIVSLKTGNIVGVEALLRWKHPKRGIVSPTEFIPVAEETGDIIPITEWLLHQSTLQIKDFHKLKQNLRLAINLSVLHLSQSNLPVIINNILKKNNVSPRILDLEITESAAMQEYEVTLDILKKLKKMGGSISIDDFGVGYASLVYLKRFPIDTIKIDKSFIQDIPKKSDVIAIGEAIMTMANALDIKVVAEGVETATQLSFLTGQKCDEMQGFLFSKPVSAEEIIQLLNEKRKLLYK